MASEVGWCKLIHNDFHFGSWNGDFFQPLSTSVGQKIGAANIIKKAFLDQLVRLYIGGRLRCLPYEPVYGLPV